MFLSQLNLNPNSMHVRRDIGNVYDLHRSLSSAFPDLSQQKGKSARDEYHILFRTEFSMKHNRMSILVQSKIEPNWSILQQKFPDYFLSSPEIKNITESLQKLEDGQILRFKLKANPTKRLRSDKKGPAVADPKKNGPRIPLKKDDDLIEWLIRKGNDSGFKPAQIKVTKETPIYNLIVSSQSTTEGYHVVSGGSSQKGKRNNQKLTFYGVIFDGYLVITDAKKFIEQFPMGIGSGKAFGYGLLSIA